MEENEKMAPQTEAAEEQQETAAAAQTAPETAASPQPKEAPQPEAPQESGSAGTQPASGKTPKARGRIAWGALAINVAIIAILVGIGMLIFRGNLNYGFLAGVLAYLILSTLLKVIFLKDQRLGLKYARSGDYPRAIEEFKKCYDFFRQKPYIDKYRGFFLLDYSSYSYTEIALINIGACYAMQKDYDSAREWYRKAAAEFPESDAAPKALESIERREKADQGSSAGGSGKSGRSTSKYDE